MFLAGHDVRRRMKPIVPASQRANIRSEMSTVYFSCPNFTARLVLSGEKIHKAAPIAKIFEGQPLAALTAWVAEAKLGGPVIVQKLSDLNHGPDPFAGTT